MRAMSIAVAAKRIHLMVLCGLVIFGFYCFKERQSGVNADDGKLLVIKAAFRHALERRNGQEAENAAQEFDSLLKLWNPVGRTAPEFKEVVGDSEPGWEDSASITYQFDTGWVACEWVFSIEAGRVTKFEVND